jgi:hypothetical protein
LSGVLGDERVQAMGYAVRVYLEPGKLEFHDEVLEGFRGWPSEGIVGNS